MRSAIFLSCALIFSAGCSSESAQRLEEKEARLIQREQALLVKEAELARKEKSLDSAISRNVVMDTLSRLQPALAGSWTVRMHCTETNCPGFAVGDVKTEQWQFRYEGNAVVAEAYSNQTLARIYKGTYSGSTLQLFARLDDVNEQTTKMVVRLNQTGDNEMEGQRNIERMEGCNIVYALELKKQ